jgi:glycosyltransferase involved in cell wall biosynthesis
MNSNPTQLSLAAIILTKNEERDLPACLSGLRALATDVFVIDSGSSDKTVEIAQSFGANVLHHPFSNYSKQFNWALKNIRTSADWILRIDADERISPELANELRAFLPHAPTSVTAIEVALRIQFLGRTLRWGATYPVWLLRVGRRGMVYCEETWMDEHMVVTSGEVIRVKGDLLHVIPKSLSEWSRKHVWYAERELVDIQTGLGNSQALSGQAALKRFIKDRVYLKLPLFLRAIVYWAYRYFFCLGFLDGREGFVYHFFQGLWYRMLVDANLLEARKRAPAPMER